MMRVGGEGDLSCMWMPPARRTMRGLINRKGAAMAVDESFDHDRLGVYRLAIQYTAEVFSVAKQLSDIHRQARDLWLVASGSIPRNIAQGSGKRCPQDRAQCFESARGSALECAALQDVLIGSGGLTVASSCQMKRKLKRIVLMLTQMALGADGGAESPAGCDAGHERDWCTEPGLQRPTERATRPVEGAGRSLRQGVWVFNGKRAIFPSGVFTSRENAEAWINEYGLEGTLTLYPLDQSVYDYAVENG